MALRFAAVRSRGMAQLGRVAGRIVKVATALSGAALLTATACDRPPAAESLPEWTPADHHSSDDDKIARAQGQGPAQGQGQAAPAARRPGQGAGGTADPAQIAQLVDLTWRSQCSNCHGMGGRGDGQMGPMLHATDLTDTAWQGRTSDAEMSAVIRAGKDKMPRFDLPVPVVAGLVERIRALRASP